MCLEAVWVMVPLLYLSPGGCRGRKLHPQSLQEDQEGEVFDAHVISLLQRTTTTITILLHPTHYHYSFPPCSAVITSALLLLVSHRTSNLFSYPSHTFVKIQTLFINLLNNSVCVLGYSEFLLDIHITLIPHHTHSHLPRCSLTSSYTHPLYTLSDTSGSSVPHRTQADYSPLSCLR